MRLVSPTNCEIPALRRYFHRHYRAHQRAVIPALSQAGRREHGRGAGMGGAGDCGSCGGLAIAAFAPGAVLKIAFVLIASVVAIKLLFGRESGKLPIACRAAPQ